MNYVKYINVKIGLSCYIGHGCIIGSPPEIANPNNLNSILINSSFAGVIINDNVAIRENTIIHQGINFPTFIDSNVYIHSGSIINHDCHIASFSIIAPGVLLSGNVFLSNFVQVGTGSTVKQNTIVGFGSMIGQGSNVIKDIHPFEFVFGNPSKFVKINHIKLLRFGLNSNEIDIVSNYLIIKKNSIKFKLIKFAIKTSDDLNNKFSDVNYLIDIIDKSYINI